MIKTRTQNNIADTSTATRQISLQILNGDEAKMRKSDSLVGIKNRPLGRKEEEMSKCWERRTCNDIRVRLWSS